MRSARIPLQHVVLAAVLVLTGRFARIRQPSRAPNTAADAVSGDIETLFADYFTASDLPFARSLGAAGTGLTFRNAGIPFGGLNTGFNTPKTAQEAALFGGTAGALFDACVWQACDTFANVNTTVLDQMSDAAAHVVLLLSRRNFAQANQSTTEDRGHGRLPLPNAPAALRDLCVMCGSIIWRCLD